MLFLISCFILFFFLSFISIVILLTRRKATEALIHRVSNYPDLLPEMPRYCCPVEIFMWFFSFYQDMTNLELLVKTPKQGKASLSVFSKDTTEWCE